MAEQIANLILNSPYESQEDPFKETPDAEVTRVLHDFGAAGERGSHGLFDKLETGEIAVKVINDYGDEVMKVFEL